MTSSPRSDARTLLSIAAEFEALTDVLARASAAIMALDRTQMAQRLKPNGSPVTSADEVAENTLLKGLAEVTPGLPVISEESARPDPSESPAEIFALVDPLDGTREFLAGSDEFTVNIAIVADGQPRIGLVAAPALGLIWRGIVGRGAERLTLASGGLVERHAVTPIHTRPVPSQGLTATVSRSHFDARTQEFLNRLSPFHRLACGSSLKFCRIAEGSADVYPRLAPTSEWDIAAGQALVVAAGGSVLSPDNKPLLYGRAGDAFRVPAFIAWGVPAPPMMPR